MGQIIAGKGWAITQGKLHFGAGEQIFAGELYGQCRQRVLLKISAG
jgi:hypothetical protein